MKKEREKSKIFCFLKHYNEIDSKFFIKNEINNRQDKNNPSGYYRENAEHQKEQIGFRAGKTLHSVLNN